MCVCVCVCVCVVKKRKKFPKVMNLLRKKVDVKTFQFLMNFHQDFMIVKQVFIEQRWMFDKKNNDDNVIVF